MKIVGVPLKVLGLVLQGNKSCNVDISKILIITDNNTVKQITEMAGQHLK